MRSENHRLRRERDILAKAAAWFAAEQGEPERVHRFMSAHQGELAIRTMARVLKGVATMWATTEANLTRRVRTIHAGSRATYGAPRVHAELAAQGVHLGRKPPC